MQQGVFIERSSSLEDPRIDRTRRNLFLDIIGFALFAGLAGAQCYTEIEDFRSHHHEWLKEYFHLSGGIPSNDTFARVFLLLIHPYFKSDRPINHRLLI